MIVYLVVFKIMLSLKTYNCIFMRLDKSAAALLTHTLSVTWPSSL